MSKGYSQSVSDSIKVSVSSAINAIRTQDSLRIAKREIVISDSIRTSCKELSQKSDSLIMVLTRQVEVNDLRVANLSAQISAHQEINAIEKRYNSYLKSEIKRQQRSKWAILFGAVAATAAAIFIK